MIYEKIGFNFINQCNNEFWLESITDEFIFTSTSSEQINLSFIKFVHFDEEYDAVYYNPKINNSNISYYGNAILTQQEIKQIDSVMFSSKVLKDYLNYLEFTQEKSTRARFINFWLVTLNNYKIKVEPAELFKM